MGVLSREHLSMSTSDTSADAGHLQEYGEVGKNHGSFDVDTYRLGYRSAVSHVRRDEESMDARSSNCHTTSHGTAADLHLSEYVVHSGRIGSATRVVLAATRSHQTGGVLE